MAGLGKRQAAPFLYCATLDTATYLRHSSITGQRWLQLLYRVEWNQGECWGIQQMPDVDGGLTMWLQRTTEAANQKTVE